MVSCSTVERRRDTLMMVTCCLSSVVLLAERAAHRTTGLDHLVHQLNLFAALPFFGLESFLLPSMMIGICDDFCVVPLIGLE